MLTYDFCCVICMLKVIFCCTSYYAYEVFSMMVFIIFFALFVLGGFLFLNIFDSIDNEDDDEWIKRECWKDKSFYPYEVYPTDYKTYHLPTMEKEETKYGKIARYDVVLFSIDGNVPLETFSQELEGTGLLLDETPMIVKNGLAYNENAKRYFNVTGHYEITSVPSSKVRYWFAYSIRNNISMAYRVNKEYWAWKVN